jgi:hypothetical protein
MLSLSSSVRSFLAVDATDMRKSFEGLASEAQRVIAQDPLSGHLFVFFNRRRTRAWAASSSCPRPTSTGPDRSSPGSALADFCVFYHREVA